jgi:hypothetical protein
MAMVAVVAPMAVVAVVAVMALVAVIAMVAMVTVMPAAAAATTWGNAILEAFHFEGPCAHLFLLAVKIGRIGNMHRKG